MSKVVTYKIVWDNGHATGELPITYLTFEAAVEAAKEWWSEMTRIDDDPKEAASDYSWSVVRVD